MSLRWAPAFRAGVELVEVDVYVTDENDQPAADLTAGDFEVRSIPIRVR